MTANADSIRNVCAGLIEQIIRDSSYQTTIARFQSIQKKTYPTAKNSIFQTELNKTYDIYQRVISQLVLSLQNRHRIVQQCASNLSQQLNQDHLDIGIIVSSLEDLTFGLFLLQTQVINSEKETKLLTDRIDVLTTEQYPPRQLQN